MNFIPAYPRIDATIRDNLTGELTINGTSFPLIAPDLARLRAGVIARCAATARQVHRPVRVQVVDVAGTYALAIHPDAYVQILNASGNTPDLAAGAARPVNSSPCVRCQQSVVCHLLPRVPRLRASRRAGGASVNPDFYVMTGHTLRHAAQILSVPGTFRHDQTMPGYKEPRGGRPSKGDRDAFKVRPARLVGDRVRELADAAGMPYGEYISAILAREVGLPDLAPRSEHADDEELPISTVA